MSRSHRPVALASAAIAACLLAWTLPWSALWGADGFMPHGHCFLWKPGLVWMHAGSDVVIGLAYTAISVALAVLVFRARHDIPFGWMLLCFGAFIIACGAGHFLDAWTLWVPQYWLSGWERVLTAAVSLATAIMLPPLVPKLLAMVESSRRADVVRGERDRATAALRQAKDDLERRVDERTAELRSAHAAVERHTQRIRSLYEVAADAERSLDDQILAALRLGCGWFGTEIGMVARIDGDETVVEHVHTPADVLLPGDRFALADTYTELALASDGPISFEDIAESPYRDSAARWMMKMPSFIGVRLHVDGVVFGTLGFAATQPVPKAFDTYDHDVLQLLARWVGSVLERRQAAVELEATRDAALEAARLKSEFVATISHELRTPLNVIIGYADMLADPAMGPLEPQQHDLVARVMARSLELHELITATLDLGRLEAGREDVAVEPIDLPLLCCDIDAEVAPLAHDGVRLRWRHPSGVGPILGDRGKLKTILKNLIGNALKFTDAGNVDVETQLADDLLTVVVRDTGIGMTPTELAVVFDSFRQADASPTRRHGGVGLGLHIVKRLTALLHGDIHVESTRGAGSTFTLRVSAPPAVPYRATG